MGIDPDDWEAAKAKSVGQLLMKSARLFNDRGIERVRKVMHAPGFRVAHTALFPHIDLEGTRLTTLADRVGVTKQAVAQLVVELVEMGALRRIPDPNDGRAKLIMFTDKLKQGLTVLMDIEKELEAAIGAEQMIAFRDTLTLLVAELETLPKAP